MAKPMNRSYESPKAQVVQLLAFYELPDAVSLVEAVAAGHDDAERCTANDVATRANWVRWATPLRYLRDEWVPRGWKGDNPGGYELLISPDGKRGIGVAQGDSATGTSRMPTTLRERGPLTLQAVRGNRNQMRFPAEVHPEFAPPVDPDLVTWILLSHYDREANEIRIELSRPVEFTKSYGAAGQKNRGYITQFDPRISLPTISLQPVAYEDPAEAEPIEISVQRRQAS